MRIAIVGNGPLERDRSAEIGASDLVIRFNMCENFGRNTGTRADVLALSNTGKTGRRFGTQKVLDRIPAFPAASQIWLPRNPGVYSARKAKIPFYDRAGRLGNTDFGPDILRRAAHRRVVVFDAALNDGLAAKMQQCGGSPDDMPSTGLLVIEYVLEQMKLPQAREVVLYGFSHTGNSWHAWDTERRLIEQYVSAGRVARGD